jgi:membrane-bound lytic murein transglycosylase B
MLSSSFTSKRHSMNVMNKKILALLLSGACLALVSCSSKTPTTPAPADRQAPNKAEPAVKPAADEPKVLLPPSPGISQRPAVREFIADMSRKHGFSTAELTRAFDEAGIVPSILDAMAKPYEAKPWHAYRKLFLTEKRINGGREFMSLNAAALAKAKSRYGVPPEMVTAIIGVESAYGFRPGKYRVIDSLSTLAFDYPRRASFFRSELEQFLLLCREEGMDYLAPLGSYAGAMGMPQFMPSSYRKLAADGDGDGKRDIWNNPADAIASVANYFAKNGWHSGEPIAVPARISGDGYQSVVSTKNPKATHTLGQLASLGVTPEEPVSGGQKAGLVQLAGETGPDYWITFHNFSVIMRYNHSPLYAMAAYELTREW